MSCVSACTVPGTHREQEHLPGCSSLSGSGQHSPGTCHEQTSECLKKVICLILAVFSSQNISL